jgi:hypothetical protein
MSNTLGIIYPNLLYLSDKSGKNWNMSEKPKKERNITGLALGRGKRPKLDNPLVGIRMSASTKEALEKIAEAYGIRYGGQPHLGGLLAQIAEGKLLVVPAPPKQP